MAVAGAEKVVGAHIVGLLLKRAKLGQQRFTFRHIGVVDLIVADVIPVVGQFAEPLARIDGDLGRHGWFFLLIGRR